MFGHYSKLVGSLVGSLVGIVVAYAASKGFGTCVPPAEPGGEMLCSIFGYTSGQITGVIVSVISAAFVYYFPRNEPNS